MILKQGFLLACTHGHSDIIEYLIQYAKEHNQEKEIYSNFTTGADHAIRCGYFQIPFILKKIPLIKNNLCVVITLPSFSDVFNTMCVLKQNLTI